MKRKKSPPAFDNYVPCERQRTSSSDCTLGGYLKVLNAAGRGPDSGNPINADYFDVLLPSQRHLL